MCHVWIVCLEREWSKIGHADILECRKFEYTLYFEQGHTMRGPASAENLIGLYLHFPGGGHRDVVARIGGPVGRSKNGSSVTGGPNEPWSLPERVRILGRPVKSVGVG